MSNKPNFAKGRPRTPELGVDLSSLEVARSPLPPGAPPGGGVVVGWLSAGDPEHEFLMSMLDLQEYDFHHERWMARPGGGRIGMVTSPRVAEGRTQLVEYFLTEPIFAQAQALLMLDDDMMFDGDLLSRMMQVFSYPERPIVGGLAFCGGHYRDQWPTIYEMYQDGPHWGVRPVFDYPDDALVKVGATGAACLLVHRQVYVGMAAAPWNRQLPDGRPNPYPWFAEGLVAHDGAPLGEDIAFCRKAVQLDIPIHVHTGIQLGHVKRAPLTAATFRGQMAEREQAVADALSHDDFVVIQDDLVLPDGSKVSP